MTEQELSNAMNAYGDTVYRLALCRLQNAADAEDVYQDVFLRLLGQKTSGWDGEHLKAWLIRTALNRCADLGRLRQRRGTLSLEEVPDMARPAVCQTTLRIRHSDLHAYKYSTARKPV